MSCSCANRRTIQTARDSSQRSRPCNRLDLAKLKERLPRHYKKSSNETKIQTQSSAFQASEQEPTADGVSKESPRDGFLYIIEAAEKVIGAFTRPTNAYESVIAYA